MDVPSTSEKMKRYNRKGDMMPPTYDIFNQLRLAGEHCDVILQTDGIDFKAHKIILCGASSYFQALFSSCWTVPEECRYKIHGISPEMMSLILEYVYTYSVLITLDNVESLLAAADHLNIISLVQCCSDFLEGQLCLENCIGIFNITDVYCCAELHQTTYHFLLQHFTEVARTSMEFLELTLSQLCTILEKDELNVRQEDVVFDAILRWIMYDPANRKAHIAVLLSKVRLARMEADYFMRVVQNNEFVRNSEECKPIIVSTIEAMYDLDVNAPQYSAFQNSLTRPRLPSDILFAIGGWSDSPTNRIEAYDTRADRWVEVSPEGLGPRAYHGTACLKGFVYCVGGYDGTSALNTVCKFDPVSRTWHQVAPMHSRRCYVSVAVLHGYMYAMGGFDGLGRLNTVERYDPESNRWTLIQPMNSRRSDACATTLHGKVYICGGYNGIQCLSTAECYDPRTNHWTPIAPMRVPRCSLGVIAYNEKIYAVGGSNGSTCFRSVEAYDPLTNRWCAVAPMLNPHQGLGIEVVDDLLFVVGGFDGLEKTCIVECYDGKTGSWYRAQDMAISRSAVRCCVVPGLPSILEYAAPREPLVVAQDITPSTSNDLPNG
ncbi:kelch-like protein 10 isoform X1 [Brienomyrus brachyistius]|uniref:kelch-like protein 10 isoform X1 n=2 Tax=Brienomyrus brachyistius TaxID=42636 RepID=UPI0020B38B37|nr:kelch-like protein 10 isoform X1 [Brienomyrus brachyistius]